MALPIHLTLIHPKPEMCDAFEYRFSGLPRVRVLRARFEELEPHDCFVTAANSFGIMNAGIDAAVIRFHGEALMHQIQYRILDEYLGEQPIGTSFIQETGNVDYPYVAHTPTMRVPGSIRGTDKVYCAAWAALLAIYQHNVSSPADRKIDTVVFPALGAGFGGVEPSEVARQMACAYQHYLSPPHRFNWDTVTRRQKKICYDGNQKMI